MKVLKARLIAALHSPAFLQRVTHFVFGKFFFALPVVVRLWLFRGTAYKCPICENKLRRFFPLYRASMHWCPVCLSLQRHRLVWLLFESEHIQIQTVPRKVLHIAPEPGIAARLSTLSNIDYVSADLFDSAAMLRLDICNMDLPDASFDLVYCSHVLEHVNDDQQALREFWRVLKPGGIAVILVPIIADTTFEDLSVTNPAERERLFGQEDHVRRYGPDVIDRLRSAGFQVQALHGSDIVTTAQAQRADIDLWEPLFLCQKELVYAY